MYTLGTIDKLTEQNETGGKKIAGTGTMDDEGKVGAIGGIRLKMLGAKRDGAQWFLAPASNCSDVVGHVPSGLRVVKVSTLDGAYQALVAIGQGKASSLPTC
jgi:PDZ domain-containing protein